MAPKLHFDDSNVFVVREKKTAVTQSSHALDKY